MPGGQARGELGSGSARPNGGGGGGGGGIRAFGVGELGGYRSAAVSADPGREWRRRCAAAALGDGGRPGAAAFNVSGAGKRAAEGACEALQLHRREEAPGKAPGAGDW